MALLVEPFPKMGYYYQWTPGDGADPGKNLPQVVISPGIKCPSSKSSGDLVFAKPDLCQELAALTILRDWDAAGIEILLQAAVTPLVNQGVKGILFIP